MTCHRIAGSESSSHYMTDFLCSACANSTIKTRNGAFRHFEHACYYTRMVSECAFVFRKLDSIECRPFA